MTEAPPTARFQCGFCGEPTRAEVSAPLGRWNASTAMATPELQLASSMPLKFQFEGRAISDEKWPVYVSAQCTECGQPNLLLTVDWSLVHILSALQDGTFAEQPNFERSKILNQWPKSFESINGKGVPPTAVGLYAEASEDLRRNRNAARIIAACRTIFDICLKDLGERAGTRKQRIERLHKAGQITTSMAAWGGTLWDDGNDAIHDGEGNAKTAKEHIDYLRIFFEVCYALPAQIETAQHPTDSAEA